MGRFVRYCEKCGCRIKKSAACGKCGNINYQLSGELKKQNSVRFWAKVGVLAAGAVVIAAAVVFPTMLGQVGSKRDIEAAQEPWKDYPMYEFYSAWADSGLEYYLVDIYFADISENKELWWTQFSDHFPVNSAEEMNERFVEVGG